MLTYMDYSNNNDVILNPLEEDNNLKNINIYFANKIEEFRSLNFNYETYDELVDKFIKLLTDCNGVKDFKLMQNIISFKNLKKDFTHTFIVKIENVYVWFQIWLNAKTFIKDFFRCKNCFSTTKKLPEYLNYIETKNKLEKKELYNHKELINYIKQKHSITLKELMNINDINYLEDDEFSLQEYIDSVIENDETIIGTDNQMYKIYKWELIGTINLLVCEYFKNNDLDNIFYIKKRKL